MVPLLAAELESAEMLRRLESDGGLIVWWGTPVECVSALARRERGAGIAAAVHRLGEDRIGRVLLGPHEGEAGERIDSAFG